MDKECVLSEVGTEFLCAIYMAVCSLKKTENLAKFFDCFARDKNAGNIRTNVKLKHAHLPIVVVEKK